MTMLILTLLFDGREEEIPQASDSSLPPEPELLSSHQTEFDDDDSFEANG